MIPRILLFYTALASCVLYSEAKTAIVEPVLPMAYAQSGTSFKLICEEDSCTTVKWYKDNDVIDSTPRTNFVIYSEQDGQPGSGNKCKIISTLVKTNVEAADKGTYSCKADESDISDQMTIQVTVIEVKPVDGEYDGSSDDITLRCDVQGLNGVEPWTWYFNGTKLEEGDKYTMIDSNVSLVIHDVGPEDIGTYNCTMDKVALNQQVNLFSQPYFKAIDKSRNLVQGDTLTIEAVIYANPEPQVSWYKDDLPLDLTDERISLNRSAKNGLQNATLTIQKLDFADRADYTVVAINEFGSANQTQFVRVKDKLAALWPFLGIVAEVVILCAIIFIYERRRSKKLEEEENTPEEAGHLTNSNDHKGKDDVRQRK